MTLSTLILLAALLPLASAPQTAPAPDPATAKFLLQLSGKPIGSASYTFQSTETGWAGTSHYDFNVGALVTVSRRFTFLKNWALLNDAYDVTIATGPQSVTLLSNPTHTKFTFHAKAGDQELNTDLDLAPHTVVLPNFDPAGLQLLLNMQAADPAPAGAYQCFIPSGAGTTLPCTFTQAGPDRGREMATLDDKPLEVTHWLLKLGPVEMDVWSAANNALLEASVASQNLAYVRAGFTLAKQAAAAPPPAVPPPGVLDREVTFPSDSLTVPGTLTLPQDAKTRLPIAVLVQGSGVQDRDETVGANKVFQQLAWGLAQRGIATLRYDRRPKFAPENFAQHLDLDHEVVIDAASALAFTATVPEADPAAVFLIGHSLGAQLAPYIVQRRLQEKPTSVRGYILMAGVQTPIDQTILRQVAEFAKAQGASEAEVAQSLAKWQSIFAQVNDPKTPDDKIVGPGQVPAAYWRNWIKRDPAAVMKTLPVPALVLRGEFDRNVTHEDFTALSAAATAPGSKSQEFPGLNHLFMPVPGPTADETLPGKIAPELLDTIATWIKGIMK